MFIPGRNEIAVGFSGGSSNNLDHSVSYISELSALFDINFELLSDLLTRKTFNFKQIPSH